MSKKNIRIALSFAILAITIGAVTYFLAHNQHIITQLGETPPLTLGLIFLLYIPWYLAVLFILSGSLRIYRKRIPLQENFLLNAYSSVINFFGPGQSGPAVRGFYLKKRHNLRIKDYLFASLLYYAFFAVISAMFVSVGSRPWWQTALFVGFVSGVSYLVIKRFASKSKESARQAHFTPFNLGMIFLATLTQLVLQVVIYFIELQNINPDVTWSQAITYTGAANFAMFVALTPGAIGIRESFLLFTQGLHHINSDTIVAANLIDRGVYLVFLGVLSVLIAVLHAKDRLKLKQIKAESSQLEK